MISPRQLDDQLFAAINDLARNTPALHGVVVGYAACGVALFAALVLAALVASRHASTRDLAATGWVPLAMPLAVVLNQPIGRLVHEARPHAALPGILRLADLTTDFSFRSDHAVMAGAVAAGLLVGAAVALGGRAALHRPSIALTRWLRRLPLLDTVFTDPETRPTHPPLDDATPRHVDAHA